MENNTAYPVHIKGELSSPPSRGLWLIKWLLVVPHLFILVFLWLAALTVTLIAFFAILITGKYPKSLFVFNEGVMRWSWRVGFYAYNALGTDKYPPFTLASVNDYPADLTVEYPERLSRGLVLVKWWLLAIPQYFVICAFSGCNGIGLINLLTIIAAIGLLFKGLYSRDIFKFVIGMNRWAIRVFAYAALMTDKYPPFRLWDDQ